MSPTSTRESSAGLEIFEGKGRWEGGKREEGKRKSGSVGRVVFTWVSGPGLYKLHILRPVCVHV